MARRNRKPDPEITEAPEVVETSEAEAEGAAKEPEIPQNPARVTVIFRGPGIGMLADRQILANETREVPWNEWLHLKNNKKYERIDV